MANRLVLRQTTSEPINGYWDGGPRQTFDWSIDPGQHNRKPGEWIKIGCFSANHWFTVRCGDTERRTLANAKMHLAARFKKLDIPCTFEYVEK